MGIVIKQSLYSTIITYLGVIIGFINIIFLYQIYLSPEQYGLTNILLSVSLIASYLSQFGLVNITTRFFPYFQNKENSNNGFLFFAFLVSSIGILIISIILIFIKPIVVVFYSENASLFTKYYYYVIPLLLSQAWYSIFESYLKSHLKTIFTTFIRELYIRLLATICLILYALKIINFEEFIQLYTATYASMVIAVLIFMYYSKTFLFLPSLNIFKSPLRKQILIYGCFTVFANVSAILISNIDKLMLAYYPTGLNGVGIYSIACFISGIILIPRRSITNITAPLISEYWKTNNMKEINNIYYKSSLNLTTIGLLIFILIWANINNISEILKGDYKGTETIIILLAIAKLSDVILGSIDWIISSSKYYYVISITNILMILLMIATNYILIPMYGIIGCSIATIITMFTISLIRFLFSYYKFNMKLFDKSFLLVFLISIISLVIAYFLPLTENLFLNILIKTSAILIIFLPLIYIFKISEDINKTINSFIVKYINESFLIK